ncbi:hypothetical protein G6711_02795 [Polynucleobacter paneuropaeus]|nr:hypothetical protein [Polynucleobacter paneuropaeus]
MPEKSSQTIVIRSKELNITKRARSSYWQIHLKVKSINKWLKKSSGTGDFKEAKRIAEDWAADIRASERRGFPLVSKKFKAVATVVSAKFKAEMKAGTGKPKYADYHRAIDQYLIPFFGNHNIDRITPAIIAEFHQWRLTKVGRQLKQSTQHTHNLALTKVFNEAIELGYMTEFLRPSMKNTGESGEARGFFTHAELLALQTYLQKWALEGRTEATRNLRELLCLYVAFVAGTGVRPGTETKELKWKHIEFIQQKDTRVIHISLPQGKKGARNLIARHEIWHILDKLRELQADYKDIGLDELIARREDSYLFRMMDGTRPYSFVNVFGDGIRAAKMLTNDKDDKGRSLYSLRHYYATQRILEGYSYEELETQMGTSADMLRKHYNHLNPLMIAERLAGEQGMANGGEIAANFANIAKANVIGLVGLTTGVYLNLELQNPDATNELEEHLLKASKSS